MATANFRPAPLPTQNANAPAVASAATVALRRMNTALRQAGGAVAAGRTVTDDTYVSSTDGYLLGDTTANDVTLTLPFVAEYTRMVVTIAMLAGANTLTVAANGTDTIDGAASITVTKATTLSPTDSSTWHIQNVSA